MTWNKIQESDVYNKDDFTINNSNNLKYLNLWKSNLKDSAYRSRLLAKSKANLNGIQGLQCESYKRECCGFRMNSLTSRWQINSTILQTRTKDLVLSTTTNKNRQYPSRSYTGTTLALANQRIFLINQVQKGWKLSKQVKLQASRFWKCRSRKPTGQI